MPSMPYKKSLLFAVSALFIAPLAGCGEGFEPVAYTGFPYGNIRTAGTGVAYVRANMLPERGPVIEAAQPENEGIIEVPEPQREPEPAPAVEEPEPLQETKDILENIDEQAGDKIFNDTQEGEKIFNDKQRK